MNRAGELPGEDEQFEVYRAAIEAMRGLRVTIRTVDVGADKPLDRMTVNELRHEHALNPAMGLRAIRWSLSEPAMLRQQLRAILRASAFGKVRLLVPMIAHLSEIRLMREAHERAKQQLREARRAYDEIEVGAMIEVPAAALILPTFLRQFDFVSIGTNDLIQYTLALDRADEAVAHLYDPWHPAVLQHIARTIGQARALSPILLLDEPEAMLDEDGAQAVQTLLERLRGQRTVLFTSHRPSYIRLADFAVVMRDGGIEFGGTPDSAIEKLIGVNTTGKAA